MKDAHSPLLPLFRLLLVCALVALRAPLAQPPNLRPHSSPPIPDYKIIITPVVDTTEAKLKLQLSEISSSDVAAMSKARVYADVNVLRPKDYWDYESLTVQWGWISISSSLTHFHSFFLVFVLVCWLRSYFVIWTGKLWLLRNSCNEK